MKKSILDIKGFSIGVANNSMEGYKCSGMDGSAGTFFCRAIIIPEADFAFTIIQMLVAEQVKWKQLIG